MGVLSSCNGGTLAEAGEGGNAALPGRVGAG